MYPDYLRSFDSVVSRKSGYMFNMMILPKNLMDDYCEWLFNILFELDKRIDSSSWTDFQKRYIGRISEIIFNVWLDKKIVDGVVKNEEVAELPFIYMEKVNKFKKGTAFLKAKFFHKGYEKSF